MFSVNSSLAPAAHGRIQTEQKITTTEGRTAVIQLASLQFTWRQCDAVAAVHSASCGTPRRANYVDVFARRTTRNYLHLSPSLCDTTHSFPITDRLGLRNEHIFCRIE